MVYPRAKLLFVLGIALLPLCARSTTERADFDAPVLAPCTASDIAELCRLVAKDPAAREVAEVRIKSARQLLNHIPRPMQIMHFDGLVDADPRRRETVERLQDIGHLDTLLGAFWIDPDPAFSAAAARILVAWTSVYLPTGNATNESKLIPLVIASRHLRPVLSSDERTVVDRWIKAFAAQAQAQLDPASSRPKSIKLVAACAWALDDPLLRSRAREAFLAFIARDLRPDGSSEVFERRDALSYHVAGLRHLLEIADLMDPELYHTASSSGASLARSISFLKPYVRGELQHAEWVDSKSSLDHRRAASGTSFYQPGRIFQPAEASLVFALTSRWDASLAAHITPADAWVALVSKARRTATPVALP